MPTLIFNFSLLPEPLAAHAGYFSAKEPSEDFRCHSYIRHDRPGERASRLRIHCHSLVCVYN